MGRGSSGWELIVGVRGRERGDAKSCCSAGRAGTQISHHVLVVLLGRLINYISI